MANHGFISSTRTLDKDQVLLDLQEINNRRFGGKLAITFNGKEWHIHYPSEKYVYGQGFLLWIRSPKKLEHRHTIMWGYYLEIVFAHELGTKYNGKLSDEGVGGTWKSDVAKYPTYKSWVDEQLSYVQDLSVREELEKFHMGCCPKDMVDY